MIAGGPYIHAFSVASRRHPGRLVWNFFKTFIGSVFVTAFVYDEWDDSRIASANSS